ncbi:MAG: glycerophosphodiester phosphodiesterase [Clostridia bacterium]|nr:glycerophosphodiester phosphodiesterase [Clostridia bacterium]
MTKNYAHRGFSGKYPENTMLAFKKAVEAGAEGAELDVHFSKDKELVIIHDETLDRTTDGSGRVMDFTYDELCKFDAHASYKGRFDFQKIPTLREYFEFVKNVDGFMTNIELKTGIYDYPGIEKAVLELIDEFDLRDRIIISSFNHFSVLRFKKLAPDVKCGFLEESRLVGFAEYTKQHGIEYVHPLHYTLDDQFFKEIRANGLGINTWTVNDEEDMRRMIENGVDAIIGNYPDLAKKVIDSYR